ncbi:MAG: autotransporter-associated beta strand repeat-containing protein, partial [Verrucomicrobia bacterium]|nr:autotransporter-associated beta strand repeat-containing protein [Verrucomicrobiota bacterium]
MKTSIHTTYRKNLPFLNITLPFLLWFAGGNLAAQQVINATSASVDWSEPSGWVGGAVPGEEDVARFPSSLSRNNAVGPSVMRGMELAGWGSSVSLRSGPESPLVLREHATHGPALIDIEHSNITFQIEPLSGANPKRSALHVEGEADLTIGFMDFFHGHFGAPAGQAYGDTILNVQPVAGQNPEESAILLRGSVWQPSVTRGVFHLDGSRLSFLQEIDQTTGDTADHFHVFEGEIHGTGSFFTTADSEQALLWQGGASSHSGDSVLGNQVRIHLSAPNLLSPNSRWVFVDNFAQPGGHLLLNGHAQTVGGLHDPDGLGTLNTGGATLTVRETANGVFRGALAGGGSLIKTGGGRLLFEPDTANLDGTAEVREGVLAVPAPATWGEAAPVLSGGWLETAQTFTTDRPLTLADPGDRSHEGLANALLIPGGTAATWTGGLSGSGPLHKTGGGALHLSGGSTHSGLISVHEGDLHLAEEGLINSASAIHLLGGTLHTGGFSHTFAILAGTEGTLNTGAGGTILLTQTASTIFGGHLSGAATIHKTGAANLTLSRADQSGFTGGWRVDAGRLTLQAPGSLGGGASDLQLDGGELAFSGTGAFSRPVSLLAGGGGIHAGTEATEITWSGAISGEGGFTKSGPGLLYLTGGNTYTGLTTVAGGILRGGPASFPAGMRDLHIAEGAVFDTGGHGPGMRLLSGKGTLLTGGGPVFINHQGDTHFEGVFSGGGRIVKDGEGVLALSGENEYPAETRVVNGILRALTDNTFSPDSLHEIYPQGTLDLNDHDQHIGGLIGGGPVTLGTARLTVADTADRTFAGVISGEGGVTKQGAGVWTLTQPQTFTGETRVEGGRLVLDGANRLAAGSPAHVGGGATLELRGAQTLSAVGGSGAVDLNGGSLILTPAEETSLGVSLGGEGGLEINGPHRVTLTGVNTYTGLTHIAAGSLRLSPGGFPGGMAALSIGSEGTLELNGLSPTVAGLSGAGTVSLAGGTMNLNQSADTLFEGTFEGIGVVHKYGAGVLSLGGENTYTATTRVSNGVLRAVAANTFSAQSPHEITGAGVLDLQDFDQTLPGLFGNGTVQMDGATLILADAADRSFTGTLSGNGILRKTGAATLALGGSGHDFDGEIRVENGVLALLPGTVFSAATRFHVDTDASLVLPDGDFALANLSGAGSLQTANGRLTISTAESLEFSGNITGMDGLTKTGSGTLTLSGGNNWTSELRVEQGTLVLQGAQTLPDDLPVFVAAGATLRIEGFTARIASLSGGGTVALDAQSTLHLAFEGAQTVTAPLTGGGGLTVDGDGILTLAAANTLEGSITVANGTLRLGHADALSTTDALEVAEGATLDLNDHDLTLAWLSGGGTVLTGDGTLIIHNDVHRVIQASLSGAGTLRKRGTGTLELTGDVSGFSGDLILETGLLRLPLAPEPASLQFAGGTLALTQSQTLDFPVTAEATGGVLLAENSAHLILDTPVDGPGSLHLGGNGSFLLAQA